jgi:hypothetical protein
MKRSRDKVAMKERNAMTETAMRPLRWAKGNGLISSVTSLVNRGSSSLPEDWALGMRVYNSIEDILYCLQDNRKTSKMSSNHRLDGFENAS